MGDHRMDSSDAAERLTSRQRQVVIGLALLCALSRLLAISRSIWEWDEALFTSSMRDFDVTMHHPHPPGFPVYIALARLLRPLAASDFDALQTLNLVAAMLVFPAMYLFARQLRFRPIVAVMAATLFAFLPNVWYFGGTAFSDLPSIVLVLFAVTSLLRGAHERNAYWLGALLLALAIGIRPQNLLIGLFPAIFATRRRKPVEIVVALLIGMTIVGTAFGGAALATGSLDDYLRVVREHGEYIARVDSWRSGTRPPLWRLLDRFFAKQYQSPVLGVVASLLVIFAAVEAVRRRSRPMLYAFLTFAPFALVAWLMLDRFSVSRFSIAYQPMFAIFAAWGIARLADRVAGDAEKGAWLAPAMCALLTLGFIAYAWPALRIVRTTESPSFLATQAAAKHVDASRDELLVGHTMVAFADLLLPGREYLEVADDHALPLSSGRPVWLLAEITDTPDAGLVFHRARGHLWNIARRNFFDVKLQRIERPPVFESGWYDFESDGKAQWRWMSGRSVTLLPPAEKRTRLELRLGIPAEVMPQNPKITVTLNGRVIDEFRTTAGEVTRSWSVDPATPGAVNRLELTIDQTLPPSAAPGGDTRELGLVLRQLSWG